MSRLPSPWLAGPALALLAGAALAQDPAPPKPAEPVQVLKLVAAQQQAPLSQEELQKKRAEKLAKPVFKNAAWLTDYDAARKQCKQEGKLLLVYFTRSYAH